MKLTNKGQDWFENGYKSLGNVHIRFRLDFKEIYFIVKYILTFTKFDIAQG